MLQCWTDKVDDRPSFIEVTKEVTTFLSTEGSVDQQEEGETQPLQSNIQPGGSAEYLGVAK